MIQASKWLCSIGISFGRSKLLQSCRNFTLRSELEQTVIACLAGRNAQEVSYSRFVQTPSGDSRRFFVRHLQCRSPRAAVIIFEKLYARLFRKVIYRLEWTSKWLWRESWSFGRLTLWIRWAFMKNVYNFPFINYSRLRLANVLFFATIVFDEAWPKVLCIHTKLQEHCLSSLLREPEQ